MLEKIYNTSLHLRLFQNILITEIAFLCPFFDFTLSSFFPLYLETHYKKLKIFTFSYFLVFNYCSNLFFQYVR